MEIAEAKRLLNQLAYAQREADKAYKHYRQLVDKYGIFVTVQEQGVADLAISRLEQCRKAVKAIPVSLLEELGVSMHEKAHGRI